MVRPLSIEVILFNPAVFNRCMDCEIVWAGEEPTHHQHLEIAVSHMPREVAQDYLDFSHWVMALLDRYPEQVDVRIIDAISVEGVAKSTQFGINYYPAVIINHNQLYSWQNLDQAVIEIERIMREYQAVQPQPNK
jgi:hypothetical protein